MSSMRRLSVCVRMSVGIGTCVLFHSVYIEIMSARSRTLYKLEIKEMCVAQRKVKDVLKLKTYSYKMLISFKLLLH